MRLSSLQKNAGSTIVVVLLFTVALAAIGANVLISGIDRYNAIQKGNGWQEALFAAEAGADVALANVRWTTVSGSPAAFNSSASPAWTTSTATYNGSSYNVYRCWMPGFLSASNQEGSNTLSAMVEVDAHPALKDSAGNQWFRIRSTGYANLPGGARVGNDKPDGQSSYDKMLRRFDLRVDHFVAKYGGHAFGGVSYPAGSIVPVTTPQATRRIEVIAKPKTPFAAGVVALSTSVTPNPFSIGRPVDSYDSSRTDIWPGGLYSEDPRDPATGVGCNGSVMINAPIASFYETVYGNLGTNGGSVPDTADVSGDIDNKATVSLPAQAKPAWTTWSVPGSSTITAPAAGVTARYKTANLADVVIRKNGATSGTVEIWATGDVTKGITVEPGVTLKIYFEGNLSMKARDVDNQNNRAANLQLYGIDPPSGLRSIDFGSGNPGNRYFTLYAPKHAFSSNGNPDFCGAIVAWSVNGNGNTSVHYDEALASVGPIIDYNRASWVEDTR